jgi:hypothetical protein
MPQSSTDKELASSRPDPKKEFIYRSPDGLYHYRDGTVDSGTTGHGVEKGTDRKGELPQQGKPETWNGASSWVEALRRYNTSSDEQKAESPILAGASTVAPPPKPKAPIVSPTDARPTEKEYPGLGNLAVLLKKQKEWDEAHAIGGGEAAKPDAGAQAKALKKER